MERSGTEVAEGRRIGDLGSADATAGMHSTGVGAYRRWHRAAHGKVQRACVGRRGDAERHRRNALTPAVGVPKCERYAGVRRGRKLVSGRCAHGARGRDATDGVAAETRMSLPVVGGHVRHEHALSGLVGGRGVGRGGARACRASRRQSARGRISSRQSSQLSLLLSLELGITALAAARGSRSHVRATARGGVV